MSKQFNEDGTYNKTDWKAGDKITATKLNKIEDAIEAVNDHDVSRHQEADARLDALEAGVVANKQEIEAKVEALEDTVVSNKDAADLDIYRIDQHMTLLDKKIDDGVAEVYGVAETVDGAIDKGKADMEAMVEAVEGELDRLHAKDIELSAQLEHIKKETTIYPDDFEGTDTEKIQKAFNKAFEIHADTSTPPCIIVNRNYILNSPIYFKEDAFYEYIYIMGEGGTLTQNFNGFMFESYAEAGNRHRHAPLFENVRFKRADGVTMACVINGDKFIRAMFDKCNFSRMACINTEGYIQTLRLHNCEIGGNLTTHFIKANMCYDCSIIDCRFEQHTSPYSAVYIAENESSMNISYMSLRIISSLFEGYYQAPAIQLGSGYGLDIHGCYFESNKENIIFSKVGNGNGKVSGQITACTFMTTKSDDGYSIKFNSMNVSNLLVDYNTTNDKKFANIDIRKDAQDTSNFAYGGGRIIELSGTVKTKQNANKCKLIIKRDPVTDDGRLLFKFPTPWWNDLHSTVTGAFLISVTFGYGTSAQYRGAVTILAHAGSCWQDGIMTKVVTYSVLGGLATLENNGNNGTNFESIDVFWDETGSRKTTSAQDTKYISVSIKNTNESRLSLCSGSIMRLGDVLCDTWEVIE